MFGLVLTTVGVADVLVEYAENLRHSFRRDMFFVVVGDRKTPFKQNRKVEAKLRSWGFDCVFLTVAKQKNWLRRYPELSKIIPFNSDNRRNLGYLYAAEKGADEIVVVDDDCFPLSNGFFEAHKLLGLTLKCNTIHSRNGWFNPCNMLEFNCDSTIFMRGFPFNKRLEATKSYFTREPSRVVANVGLWLEKPDVDAATHLLFPKLQSKRLVSTESVVLGKGVYAPINTQNTAFLTEILPCFYFWKLPKDTGWFGDVFAGLFARKVMDHMGDTVAYGKPLTIHRRQERDELAQLKRQLPCMMLHEELCRVVPSVELSATSYIDASLELIAKLAVHKFETRWAEKYLRKIDKNFRVWLETCDEIM